MQKKKIIRKIKIEQKFERALIIIKKNVDNISVIKGNNRIHSKLLF